MSSPHMDSPLKSYRKGSPYSASRVMANEFERSDTARSRRLSQSGPRPFGIGKLTRTMEDADLSRNGRRRPGAPERKELVQKFSSKDHLMRSSMAARRRRISGYSDKSVTGPIRPDGSRPESLVK